MKNVKLLFSYAIILIISLMFAVKYLSRFSKSGTLLGFIVVAVQLLAIIYLNKKKIPGTVAKYFAYILLIALIIFTILCHKYIKLESLNVDRWSVISSFFTELFNGNYPYYAKSYMGNFPGAMPVYFVIAFPFYLTGELNILSVSGYILFIVILIKQKHVFPRYEILFFLLSTSLFVYWEIATRSNIFTYSLIVLLVLNLYNRINKNKYNKSFFLSSVLSGLILSTRGVYILNYIITFISSFKKKEIKLKPLIIYTLISVVAFSSTFLPLIVFFPEEFFKLNPFIVESSFLIPQAFVGLIILISILLTFFIKNESDRHFFNGLSLFVAISVYFLYHSVNVGFNQAFFGSTADISYFIFCIPFLFYFVLEENKLTQAGV